MNEKTKPCGYRGGVRGILRTCCPDCRKFKETEEVVESWTTPCGNLTTEIVRCRCGTLYVD